MIIAAMIRDCDWTDQKFDEPVMGYHLFSRGATGRVCQVLNLCAEAVNLEKNKVSTLEEVEAWAESVPGGYLDY
jgi:hypothetical protein